MMLHLKPLLSHSGNLLSVVLCKIPNLPIQNDLLEKKPCGRVTAKEPYKTQLLVLWMSSRALAYSSLSALSQAQASSLPN